MAELGVVVGGANAHIAHRVGEGARGAAHPRGSGVGKGPSRGFWKEVVFACAASRARSGWGCETRAGRGADGRRPRPTAKPVADPVGCPALCFRLHYYFKVQLITSSTKNILI